MRTIVTKMACKFSARRIRYNSAKCGSKLVEFCYRNAGHESQRARILDKRGASAADGYEETANGYIDSNVYDAPAVDRRSYKSVRLQYPLSINQPQVKFAPTPSALDRSDAGMRK